MNWSRRSATNVSNELGDFIDQVAQEVGSNDKARTFEMIKAVLLAIRDRLDAQEVRYLGIHLPALLRYEFYDGWLPALQPQTDADQNLIETVQQYMGKMSRYAPDLDDAIEATCRLLVRTLGQKTLTPLAPHLPIDLLRYMGDRDAELHWQFNRLREPLSAPNFLD
ncbi:MAG: DUF2267 domain-containing protein [Bdellovibrionia bacterium]